MIDTSSFEYEKSRLKDLYVYFKKSGYDVYFPEQHIGECLSPYYMLKYNGCIKVAGISSRTDLYGVYIYVPENRYSMLDELAQDVIEKMKKLEPLFKRYNWQLSPSEYEPELKAFYVYLEYMNYKKN